MILYSIIIPVYNSEKTLARCLESLVSQGRDDIQVIVVNDGSIDSSEAIAKEYADKYTVIEYYYQENGGVSRARNHGLSMAKGKYVTFVDSDDYVKDTYFSVLDQVGDCDLLVFAHENVGGAPLNEAGLFAQLQKLETTEKRLELLMASRKIMSPWNKRFRRSIIEGQSLAFLPDMHTGEDFNFCTAYALCCDTIEITDRRILYADISDQESLSRRYRPNLDDQLASVFDHIAETILHSEGYRNQPELMMIVDYLFVKHLFSCICEEFKCGKFRYFANRLRIRSMCDKFRKSYSSSRCNVIHRGIRLMLRMRVYFPLYLAAYLKKGRQISG